MFDKQNDKKGPLKSINFSATHFNQMNEIQQIDILHNHQQEEYEMRRRKTIYSEERDQIYTNSIEGDQNLQFLDIQNGRLQDDIFEMIYQIQNDFDKEILQTKITKLQQGTKSLQKEIIEKNILLTHLLSVSTKQNSMIRNDFVSLNKMAAKLKDNQSKVQNLKIEIMEFEQRHFSLIHKYQEKEGKIQQLINQLALKEKQLLQFQMQKIINVQAQTQTLLAKTQSVGIQIGCHHFNRIMTLDPINIFCKKQQIKDISIQTDLSYDIFSYEKSLLQDNKAFQSKLIYLTHQRIFSIQIEPFSRNYQAIYNPLQQDSKQFKISNEFCLFVGEEIIDINCKNQTEATESEECFKQLDQFDKYISEPLMSIISMLNQIKQIKDHDEIIQKLLSIKNNKISQVLTKLLKEHKFLKLCLEKMIEKDSQREEEINSQIQITYSEVVANNDGKHETNANQKINSDINKYDDNKKKEQNQCSIY